MTRRPRPTTVPTASCRCDEDGRQLPGPSARRRLRRPRHHEPRGLPRGDRGAVGRGEGARPDGLRAGGRVGAAVPGVRGGRARRHDHRRRPRRRDGQQPRRVVGTGAGSAPRGAVGARHRPVGRRHRRADAPPRGPRGLGAGSRRAAPVRERPARRPGHRGTRGGRRPVDRRGDHRPAAGRGPAARGRRAHHACATASTSNRPLVTRPDTSRCGCPRAPTPCC